MNLAEGDRIKTGAKGLALITFLDGSTVTVLPDAEVTVKQTGSERGNSGIRMLIHAGRVWARVVQAAGRRSSPLSLESNEYTATAHDGLIGAEHSGNGFVCWTRRGELRLTDRSGQTDVVLMPGRRARAIFGSPVVPGALRAERERARGPDVRPGPAPAAHAGRPHRRGLPRGRGRGEPGLRLAHGASGRRPVAGRGARRVRGPVYADPHGHRHGPRSWPRSPPATAAWPCIARS